MIDATKLLTVKQAAEAIGVRESTLRRSTRQGEVPGAQYILERWGYDLELLKTWEIPESSRRADGKLRFDIYLTKERAAEMLIEGYVISDPREKRKARREAEEVDDGDA